MIERQVHAPSERTDLENATSADRHGDEPEELALCGADRDLGKSALDAVLDGEIVRHVWT
jgi:hypothetical protein